MATHPATARRVPAPETNSGAFWMVAAMLLGFAVAVVAFFALMMWADARESRDAVARPTAVAGSTPGIAGHDHSTGQNTALPSNSFAGVVPENASELAEAHMAYDATLPPVTPRCSWSRWR